MQQVTLLKYILHLADNSLILAQRNSEWCGHGPVLEQDIAITNISLDLLGQARNFYQYAAALYNGFNEDEKQASDYLLPRIWKTYDRELNEDDIAFLRDEHQYRNISLVELPNSDWAQTILRQFLFSAFQYYQYSQLQKSTDTQLAAIAEKALKEVTYHLRWSSEWVIRLGDGTEESHNRINKALNELWNYTGELFIPTDYEQQAASEGYGVDVTALKNDWQQKVQQIFSEATLTIPASEKTWSGLAKEGIHTEYMGYILAEMQYLQRAYPNAIW